MKMFPKIRYELISCAFTGHRLAGVGAGTIRPVDEVFMREAGGIRWHRCLRCNTWLPKKIPKRPTSEFPPEKSDIDLPIRGQALRDRYVLRLIALDRAVHVLILTLIAVLIFLFASHQQGLRDEYYQILHAFQGVNGSITLSSELVRLQGLFQFNPAHVFEVGLLVAVFAAIEAVEMVGLWQAKRWAEYLTFVATILFIPYEIYELAHGVTVVKVVALCINLLIAAYLLYAKRLFGINGGAKGEKKERKDDTGWGYLERTAPKG